MSTSVQEILNSFDQLPDADKQAVLREMLRRTEALELGPLTDDDLVLTAEAVFLDLDARETNDANTQPQ